MGASKRPGPSSRASPGPIRTGPPRVKAEVGQAYLELLTARQRLTTGRYQVGLSIFLNVVDAENPLLRVQPTRVNALTQLDLARATLARAIGEPPAGTGAHPAGALTRPLPGLFLHRCSWLPSFPEGFGFISSMARRSSSVKLGSSLKKRTNFQVSSSSKVSPLPKAGIPLRRTPFWIT